MPDELAPDASACLYVDNGKSAPTAVPVVPSPEAPVVEAVSVAPAPPPEPEPEPASEVA